MKLSEIKSLDVTIPPEFFTDCSEYLEQISNYKYSMYRGSKRTRGHVDNFIPNARNFERDRRPTDTPEVIHNVMNGIFEHEFGVPFRNGMICTGSYSQASDYGIPYVIFPCNGYDLCFSTQYRDFTEEGISMSMAKYANDYENAETDDERDNAMDELEQAAIRCFRLGDYAAGIRYTEEAIKSNNEIMLHPSRKNSTLHYYMFTESFYINNILPQLNERNK